MQASQLWQQMEGLRFRLSDCVSVNVLDYDGRSSYLLQSAFTRQKLRLSQGIYRLLMKFDGRRTLGQICAAPEASEEPTPARQQEIVSALTQLQAAGMISSDKPREITALIRQGQGERREKQFAKYMRLLSPRLPLVDPDRFLAHTFPWIRWLFQPLFLYVWMGISLWAGLQALMHWNELYTYAAQRLDDPRQWILLVCVYPLVKGLHELGHCFAVKSGGAAVNELGITFLVFLPVPYVDASASSVFADKYRRMLVGAAGIMVEMFMASMALIVWLNVSEGVVRDIAFAIMLISGVSTLLFNGNPLLRFDGYYVLADAIEIPNLYSRASQYYQYLFRRYVLGVEAEKSPSLIPRERRWFVVFGSAALVYRISISIGIAVFLIVTIPLLGTLLATWLLTVQLLIPLLRQLNYLLFNPALSGRRARVLSLLTGGVVVLSCALVLVPVPSSTVVEGVVMLPQQAVIRARIDGFLENQNVSDDSPVDVGDPLFVLNNEQLTADIKVLEARVLELRTRYDMAGYDERLQRDIYAERLDEVKAELAQLQQREADLMVRSPGRGTLQIPLSDEREGRLISKGDMLAYIADTSDVIVRIVAVQKDAGRIREDAGDITVRLAARSEQVLTGTLLGEVPLASDQLPSAALGSRSGGAIQVDARDERGITVLERVFAFDVAIPHGVGSLFVGSRALVRIQHTASPLLLRWNDALRNMLRSKFGPP
ncbi:MAG: HlyD family efflux transporter periplasmic adaptor subunit [Granulosicoccus sp.]|nr:HlyD family efflux transporter periplasmic adaptor subunit [Granulosicoccus sp.]